MERRDSISSSGTFSRSISDYHIMDQRRRHVDEERAKHLFRRASKTTEDIAPSTSASRLTSERGFLEPPTKKKTLLPRVHRKHINGPEAAEKAILSCLGLPYNKMFVTLPNLKKVVTMNTLEIGTGPPLLLLHGFSGALGFWVKNLPQLSRRFTIYVIDLLGWGRSTGPKFKGKTEAEAEDYFVSSLESWREVLSLKDFFLVGHSLGGYIACVYAMKYPERVKGMLLLEPWGFFDCPESLTDTSILEKEKAELRDMFTTPTSSPAGTPSGVPHRWYGPWGTTGNPKPPKIIRPDLSNYLSDKVDPEVFQDYMQYCIVNGKHDGEAAWRMMSIIPTGGILPWARCSIESRLPQLTKADIPISFVYGSNSFMHSRDFCGSKLHKVVPKLTAQLLVVHGTSHHLYMEKPKDFNFIVISALLFSERDPNSFLGLNNHLNMAYQKFCKFQRERKEKKDKFDSSEEKDENLKGKGKQKESKSRPKQGKTEEKESVPEREQERASHSSEA